MSASRSRGGAGSQWGVRYPRWEGSVQYWSPGGSLYHPRDQSDSFRFFFINLLFISLQNNKYGKRPLDESGDDPAGKNPSGSSADGGGPPAAKIQCTTTTTTSSSSSGTAPGGGPAKFSVEIVQQLEFTASASGATSVSVKTLTNTSVKSEVRLSLFYLLLFHSFFLYSSGCPKGNFQNSYLWCVYPMCNYETHPECFHNKDPIFFFF